MGTHVPIMIYEGRIAATSLGVVTLRPAKRMGSR
jgi:hypothetical protein